MKNFIFILSLLSLIALTGCSSADLKNVNIDEKTAEGTYNLAEYYAKNKRYEEALARLRTLKNKFPYSKYAVLSELKLADIEFTREFWPEAETAYRLFKEFHPKHPKSDYVSYRMALSQYNQLPSTIDRDLTDAYRTIRYFDDVIQSYPKSEWVKDSKDYKNKTIKMLAEKEQYIASFYFIREHYLSALGRYEGILKRFKGIGAEESALYGAAVSAYKVKDMEKAKDYLDTLATKYPDSDLYKKAKGKISE